MLHCFLNLNTEIGGYRSQLYPNANVLLMCCLCVAYVLLMCCLCIDNVLLTCPIGDSCILEELVIVGIVKFEQELK